MDRRGFLRIGGMVGLGCSGRIPAFLNRDRIGKS